LISSLPSRTLYAHRTRQAPLRFGAGVELHYLAVELCNQIYTGLPSAKDGFIALPEAPGLGFELQRDAVRALAKLRRRGGRGKGMNFPGAWYQLACGTVLSHGT